MLKDNRIIITFRPSPTGSSGDHQKVQSLRLYDLLNSL